MAESVADIVKRASIYIPSDNRRAYIKRLKTDGTYDASWFEVTDYVMSFPTISQGFPDGVFLGEYQDEDVNVVFNNSTRYFNDVDDTNSAWSKYATRFKTLFKFELYAVDKDENDVLLKAWYGISFSNPINSDNNEMSFSVSSTVKILDYYTASGISLASGTTGELITRLTEKEQNGVDLFSRYFTGFSINPDSDSLTTISHPTIDEGATVLDKIKEYSFYQDFFYYIDNDGNFVWTNRDATATVQWEFNGAGQTDSSYGTNIQNISAYYNDIDNVYTKVVIDCAENFLLDQNFFSGIGYDDGTATYLSDANSATIYAQLVTDLYIGTDSKLTQLYKSDRSTLDAYLLADWSSYQDNIIDKLNGTIKAEAKTSTASITWTPGDGSLADIYGEKIFRQSYNELTLSEANTVTARILLNYKNPKEEIVSQVTGAYQLEPKDKITVNYKGEINVTNPFILGVSELGGTDVLASRTGSIRLDDWAGKIKTTNINFNNFNINQKWREIS